MEDIKTVIIPKDGMHVFIFEGYGEVFTSGTAILKAWQEFQDKMIKYTPEDLSKNKD